jgi:hypothetical protein
LTSDLAHSFKATAVFCYNGILFEWRTECPTCNISMYIATSLPFKVHSRRFKNYTVIRDTALSRSQHALLRWCTYVHTRTIRKLFKLAGKGCWNSENKQN